MFFFLFGDEMLTRSSVIHPSRSLASLRRSSDARLPRARFGLYPLVPECYEQWAHFPWIDDLTREVTAAHVECFKGIRSPFRFESMAIDEMVKLLDSEYSKASVLL